MNLMSRKNAIILVVSLALIILGFTTMKLEPAVHGYGPWALTVAPLLITAGVIVAIFSIFGFGSKLQVGDQGAYILPGWTIFFLSLIVYLWTLEETASLWDCAEFIASAYKLQVPHPPGAPLFLMVSRIFSFLAFKYLFVTTMFLCPMREAIVIISCPLDANSVP